MSAPDWIHGGTALITGASSGIGQAVARNLAGLGMKIAICARRKDRIDALADELRASGTTVLARTCDLRREDDILSMVDAVRDELGGIDAMINNAGLGRSAPLMSGETERWREMLEVNVLGLCVFTREAVRDMQTRGDRGHVIHVSSMASHRVPVGSGVYSASKFAVRSLTEGLRGELRAAGSKIRVTAISPGFVETEFARVFHGTEEAARKTYGRYDCLQPEDVAEIVSFALTRPPHVQIHDLLVRPTEQAG